MESVSTRLLAEFTAELVAVGEELCKQHGWVSELSDLPALVERFHAPGLIAVGRAKAAWLLDTRRYVRDDVRRGLVADLLLGIGLIERAGGLSARFREDGVVDLIKGTAQASSVLPASGGGMLRWSALEARVLQEVGGMAPYLQPDHVLVSGVVGLATPTSVLPEDLIGGDQGDDIIGGVGRPRFYSVDLLRADTGKVNEMVAPR
jgi:hypothetical protein